MSETSLPATRVSGPGELRVPIQVGDRVVLLAVDRDATELRGKTAYVRSVEHAKDRHPSLSLDLCDGSGWVCAHPDCVVFVGRPYPDLVPPGDRIQP